MERHITTTTCDICGKKVNEPFRILQSEGWIKYKIARSWQSGTYKGFHDMLFIVCNTCEDKKFTLKVLFYNFIKQLFSGNKLACIQCKKTISIPNKEAELYCEKCTES